MAKSKKQQHRNPLIIVLILLGIVILAGFFFVAKKNMLPMHSQPLATTYTGSLPCADCSGLVTTLTLIKQKDPNQGLYVMHELYEGKATSPIVTDGTWIITKGTSQNPNALVLALTPNATSDVTYYLVEGKTKLTMLDQNKEKIDAPFNESLFATQTKKPQLANPASQNCEKVGGTLTIKTRGDGGQYGLCQFEDNQVCEEWALYRGTCPVGGVKTTGYDTIEQQYCAWIGGETIAEPNASCTLPQGNVCSDADLYNGTCQ